MMNMSCNEIFALSAAIRILPSSMVHQKGTSDSGLTQHSIKGMTKEICACFQKGWRDIARV